MSTTDDPTFGPFKPWDSYTPYVPEEATQYEAIKAHEEALLNEFSNLSGFEAIYFYMTQIVPAQMDLQSAIINEVTSVASDFTQIEDYVNMLKWEFNDAKPTFDNPNPVDHTATFRVQVQQLMDAIDNDTLLQQTDKDQLTQPLRNMMYATDSTSLTQIWNDASNPVAPNGEPLQKILKAFDTLTTTAATVSASTQSQMQFNINEFNKLMNFDKKTIESETQMLTFFVNHMKQA